MKYDECDYWKSVFIYTYLDSEDKSSILLITYFLFSPHKPDPDLQQLVDNIWYLDKDRAVYGKDFELCYQGDAGEGGDHAPNPLICKMNEKILNRTTYKGKWCNRIMK